MRGAIVERWQASPQGEPYTFDIQIDLGNRPLEDGLVDKLHQLVDAHKNERSHGRYNFDRSSTAKAFTVAAAAHAAHSISILPYQATGWQGASHTTVAAAAYVEHSISVLPYQLAEQESSGQTAIAAASYAEHSAYVRPLQK